MTGAGRRRIYRGEFNSIQKIPMSKTVANLDIDIDDLDEDSFEKLKSIVESRVEENRGEQRLAKNQREREKLVKELDAGETPATQKTRVAFLLNHFPDTRDSDITLTLMYWEKFQNDIYSERAIEPYKLFKLERLTTIARLRAKIQNDYGLFRGKEEIQRKRRQREETFREDMLADKPQSRTIQVYADETGKTGDYVGIGSVWFLDPMASFKFQAAVINMCVENKIKGEFHFSGLNKGQIENYKSFVDLAAQHSAYASFKAVVAKIAGTTRKPDEAVRELLRILLVRGFEQEVLAQRVTPPRALIVTVDEGTHWDGIAIENIIADASQQLSTKLGALNGVNRITPVSSKSSALVQLADLFAGAINRRFNPPIEQKNYKDEFADYLIDKLSPTADEIGEGDSLTVINLR